MGKTVVKENKSGCGCGNNSHNGGKKEAIRLITGSLLFALGIVTSQFQSANLYVISAFIAAYIILGGEIVLRAIKNITRGKIFDENFLMSVATIGAFAIGEHPEAVAVMMFYQIGELFQGMAVRKSKKSITALMDIRPDYANVKNEQSGIISKVNPDSVSIGDIITVKPGEKIPLDGIVIEGESMLDTVALTGESVPRKASISDTVLSGCINKNGVLTIKVTKTFGESTVSKIIELVENASSKKAQTENFITKFARYYTPAVVILAALLAVVPPLILGGLWADWIKRGLIFLVISCPCALVVSIPLSFFGGIGGASKKGILVKGGNYLEALNNIGIVVFDKTGTLTKGEFAVTGIHPSDGISKADLLEIAAKAEAFSNHPIALSITSAANAYGNPDNSDVSNYEEIAGHGVSVKCGNKLVLAGNDKLMERFGIAFQAPPCEIGTKLYVAADKLYLGCIVISDQIKPDSKKAVPALKARGIGKTVMLTGDNSQTAAAVADELNIDDVYSELLPHEKVEKLEDIDKNHKEHTRKSKCVKTKLAFVGDGINDAPVLARADIGIAMGGLGADSAIEAADIVIMNDEPSKLAEAIDIARFTRRIVWQNIALALGVKGLFLLLGAFGIASLWEAVFADVGVSLLAVLNAMRVIRA